MPNRIKLGLDAAAPDVEAPSAAKHRAMFEAQLDLLIGWKYG